MNKVIKTELVPELRFPKFKGQGAWKLVRLNQLGELVSGLTYSPDDVREEGLLVLRSSNVQNGHILLEDKVYVRPDIKGANLSMSDDILICVRNGSKPLIGKNALIPKGIPLSTHGAFMTVFRSPSAKFVYQLFQTSAYERQVEADLGATINSINGNQFKKYEFCVPKSEGEQQKIADCLSSLDELIAAHTQKHQLLRYYKKGLLQNLFPEEGEKVPTLRFPEFSNRINWKEFKIGDFILHHKGGAALTPKDFVQKSSSEVISKKAITGGGILKINDGDETYCSDEFFASNSKSVVDNTYLMTTLRDLVPSGPSIGYIVKFGADKSYILAQGVYGLKPKKTYSSDFLIHFSNTGVYRQMMQSVMVGSTQVHIRNGDFLKLPIMSPEKDEQQKVADFLTSVDELITAQAKKIDELKAHKRGLMQRLFPPADEVVE